MSFQADADLNENIVRGVVGRESQIDFQTAAARPHCRDFLIWTFLTMAASAGRILVSHDRKTMPHAFAKFVRARPSPGLLIVSQKTELVRAIEAVIGVWLDFATDCTNQLFTIPFRRDSGCRRAHSAEEAKADYGAMKE